MAQLSWSLNLVRFWNWIRPGWMNQRLHHSGGIEGHQCRSTRRQVDWHHNSNYRRYSEGWLRSQ